VWRRSKVAPNASISLEIDDQEKSSNRFRLLEKRGIASPSPQAGDEIPIASMEAVY